MTAIAPGHAVPDPPSFAGCVARLQAQTPGSIVSVLREECREQYRALQLRALGSLISSQWLIGEAQRRKLSLPAGTLGERARAAESAIRLALKGAEPPIEQAQVDDYYRRNISRYERRERRFIDIVERLPSRSAADRALAQVVRRNDVAQVSVHEVFDKLDEAKTVPWKRAILKAIFAAEPHTLVGPLPLNGKWCFFEVTRVVPRAVKPLVAVRGEIRQRLEREQRRRTLARFIDDWRKRWIARTDCSPGYVTQKCRDFRGSRAPEAATSFS